MHKQLLRTLGLTMAAGLGFVQAQTIASFNPQTVAAGGNPFVLTVNGSNLALVSQVSWTSPGVSTPTILFINPSASGNASQFTVNIPANLIATAGNASVQACQTTSAFICSPIVLFPIRPKPVLSSTTPLTTFVGSGLTTLTLNGTNLTALDRAIITSTSSTGTVNAAGTQLTFTLPSGVVTNPGNYPVFTQDSAAGAQSNSINFPVGVQLTTLVPNSTLAGSPQPFIVTLNALGGLGTNTQYLWNADTTLSLANSSTSGTSVQLQIPANLISSPTVGTITAVSNGQQSNGLAFTALGPTTTSLSKTSATVGSAAFPLTINGTNFGTFTLGAPQVLWTVGSITTNLTPTSSNGSVMTVTIPANLLQQPGTVTIAVKNFAASGGPTSNSQTFTIYVLPVVTSVTPPVVPFNTATPITVSGTFNLGDQIIFSGATLPTTGTPTALQATVPANLLTLGPKTVQAINLAGSTSQTSVIVNVVPVITSLNPTGIPAGSASFPLTVNVTGGLNSPSGPVGYDTNNSTLSCNGLTSCIQNTPTSVSLSGLTLTYNPGAGNNVLPPSLINLGNVTAAGTGSNVATGILLTINVNSVPPSSGGSFPNGIITGLLSTNQSGATITFSPNNTTTGFGMLPGVIIGSGTPSYTYQILNPTLVINAPSVGNPPGQTLIAGGVSDTNSAVVSFNGSILPATIVNATQATVIIPANLVQTPGVVPVTISTAGVTSAPATFTIGAVAPPTLTQLSPNAATVGDGATSVSVTGANFKQDVLTQEYTGSRVVFIAPGGSPVQLTPASISQQGTALGVTIPPALLLTPGTAVVTVVNVSDGTTSGPLAFIIRPRLAISSLSPNPTAAGANVTLVAQGSNFLNGDTLLINVGGALQPLVTTFNSPTSLSAALPGSLIPTIGTYTVLARNSLGAVSQPSQLAVTLVITSLSPPFVTAGGAAFNLTANLTGGVTQNTALNYAGTQLATVSMTPTSITSTVPANLIAIVSTPPVFASTGESQSNMVNHLVLAPLSLISISPTYADAGTNGLTLNLVGTGFDGRSSATVNGVAIPTTFGSAAALTAQVPASLMTTAQTLQIAVRDSQNRTSNTQPLAILAPLSLTSLSPPVLQQGSPDVAITVNGAGFDTSTSILFNTGVRSGFLTTTLVSPTQVIAVIPAQFLVDQATATIRAADQTRNPIRFSSNSLSVTISRPAIITNLNPSSGSINTTINMTITGSGFTPAFQQGAAVAISAQVLFGTNSIPATVVSDTQITVTIPATVNTVNGAIPVSVRLADGRLTNSLPFNAFSNPVITSISPTSVDLKASGLILTVTGLYFQTGAVIVVNGSPVSTTFVNSTQVTGPLPPFTVQGSATVAVQNPGGFSSNTIGIGIGGAKPIPPTLSSLSPPTIAPGGPGFTLTASGGGFQSGAVINFGGNSLVTAVVNSSQLTGAVPANLVTQPGNVTVYVVNPDGTSTNSLMFVISGGKPVITTLNPPTISAGATSFGLGVSGTGFKSGASVSFGGAGLPTTFVSANQLTVTVPASLVKTAGQIAVTVANPDGVSSDAATFVVNPFSLNSVSPAAANVGGPGFTLTMTGVGFLSGAAASFNGNGITTTFVNSTTLTASVPASLLTLAATVPVTVTNPDGAVGGPVSFAIRNGITLTSISPATIAANSKATTITATGTGFAQGATILFNGSPIATTFGSATSVSGIITPELLTQTGTFTVSVANSNGDGSNALNFIVSTPLPPPVITSVSQITAVAGSAALTLTVNGSGFVQGSTVVFGGGNTATTFISATQLRAVVSAGQLSQGGVFTILVTNPDGQQSNTVNFTVITPLSITSLSPTALPVGAGNSTLVIAGSGIVSGSTVQFGSTTIKPDATSATQVSVTIAGSLLAQAGTLNVTVTNPDGTVSNALPFTVVPLPAISVSATITPAGTNQVMLMLDNPAPADLSGTLVLSFTANSLNTPANYVDPAMQFAAGGTSISFTIPKGAKSATLPGNGVFSPGTVAGTLTLTLTRLIAGIDNVLPSPPPSKSFTIAGTAPIITANTVKIINGTAAGFTVEVIGFTTTRDIKSITLTFTTTQSIDGGGTVTIDVSAAFNAYFASTAGLANGGTFKLDIPFTISGADANVITAVSVTLTNSVGTSQTVSGGR